jgi:hypothetical protein
MWWNWLQNIWAQDVYPFEGDQPWLYINYDERTWLRPCTKKSKWSCAPQNEAWSIIHLHAPRMEAWSYKQYWSCSYKEARLVWLASIIQHAFVMFFLHRHLGRVSTRPRLYTNHYHPSTADEARRNHGQVLTRPGHRYYLHVPNPRDQTLCCWAPTRR